MKKLLLMLLMAEAGIGTVGAQAYNGNHAFDGEHKNEVSGYIVAGNNVVTDGFGGLAASYTRHFTPRWHVGGDMQMQFGKQLFSFAAGGGYRLPLKYGSIYFDGRFHYNRYHKFNFNEIIGNLSVIWESPYVDIRLGESIIHYQHTGDGYTEPLTLTFGIGVNVRHRDNPWNLGLFFRNYDEFYYENWNINWGIRFWAPLPKGMRLFGEFNVRPAGSISQLASKYEGSVKLGLKYKW